MVSIRLPDGSVRQYDHPVTVAEVAASIGAGLAKAALGGKLDGELVDTSTLIDHDASLAIVTEKDADGLDIIRHSTAHLLAYAVKDLYPDAQVTIGPVIENGFYYDFAYSRPFTPEDLEKIEKRMAEIAKKDEPVSRRVVTRGEAVDYFKSIGEKYKAEIIESIPSTDDIKLYSHGSFTDLCRGPHVPSTGKLKVFKLMKVAGAYWRGDSKNEQLQRIYGTAWTKKEDQEAYLHMLEEAEKRDHRKLAKQLDLFHLQEESPGMVFWHPRGWTLWQQVEQYMRRRVNDAGYLEIKCPLVLDVTLWKKSGHWENYKENMFFTESEKREFALKPMNCPGHVQVFNSDMRSYRDLPLRYGEFGACHRNEPSGALHGIMRVRGFTQDDGHIFCSDEQIEAEVVSFHKQAMEVYADFHFNNIDVKLALRPDNRIGTDEVWDEAEDALRSGLRALARQFRPRHAAGAQAGAQRVLGLVPHFVGADAVVRTQRQLDVDIVEVEIGIHFHRLLVEGHDLGFDLLVRAEDVAIVLREAAHAHDAVQRAGRLVAVALAELAVAQRQVAVAAHIAVKNLHVTRAIHRLQRVGTVFRFRHEHVFAVVVPVAGFGPQAGIEYLRRLDLLVAVDLVFVAHVLLNLLPDGPALGMPEHQARRFILEVEEVELLAQFAVVALFRLFQLEQVLLLIFLLGPGGAVDALQHFVLAVAAPVGAGQFHQLEHFQLAGRWHVRAAAQVGEAAFRVQGHILVGRNRFDDFGLVGFAYRFEIGDRFVARQDLARDRLVLLGQLGHFLFDGDQVVGRERTLVGEVIVKAVFDHRTDGHLRVGEQLLDGVGQQVGRRVTDDVETIGILVGHDGEVGIFFDQKGGVDQLAVDLAGQGRLGQAGADAGGHLRHGDRAVEFTG